MRKKPKRPAPRRIQYLCPECGHRNPFVNSTVVRDRTAEACRKCPAIVVFTLEYAQAFMKRTGIGVVKKKAARP